MLDRTPLYTGQRLNLRGEGPYASLIRFDPLSAAAAIMGGWVQTGGSVRLANARKAFGVGNACSSMIGPVEVWVYAPP